MSIGSLSSNPWADPWSSYATSQSGSAAATAPYVEISAIQEAFSTTVSTGAAPGQDPASASGTQSAPVNPLQALAADIQAMFIQAQNEAATAGTAAQTSTTGSQTVQGVTQTTSPTNAQTADANPSGAAGQTEHHHHHHHHDDGGDTTGATDVAMASSSTGQTTANQGSQSAASMFAADLVQAIESYGGTAATAAISSLTV